MFKISPEPISETELKQALLNQEAGGFVSFEGWVRVSNEGKQVHALDYEAYIELAEKEGQVIIQEAHKHFEILGAVCVHRVGELKLGDMAVWVGATAAHRAEAFAACRYVIDEVKKRVPIWKKEHYADGDTGWIANEPQ